MHFVSVKDGSASISNVAHATFYIEAEPCLTETKCNFRTFGVDESFWAKEQSCISQKVGFSKWRPFFDSMRFRLSPLPSGGFIQKILNEQEFHLTRGI